LSVDSNKIEEFLKSFSLAELPYHPERTKIENIQELMESTIFVEETFKITFRTYNINGILSKNAIQNFKVLNMSSGIIYDAHLIQEDNDFYFECNFKFELKGKNVILPLINDQFITALKTEINIKSKFELSKLKVVGLQEEYNYKSNIHLNLKAYDSEGGPITYGGEKFKITFYKEDNPDIIEELNYLDMKNGVYQIYGQLNLLGKLKMCIIINVHK
jgi:hypothetical protein